MKTKKRSANFRTFTIIIVLIVLWVLFAIMTDGAFIATRNLSNLFRQMSIVGILGVGAVLIIIAGHIDMSVGFLAGFTGCVSAFLMCYNGVNTALAIIIALAIGTGFGFAQGLVVAYVGVPSFIVTLGGQMALQGMVLALTQGVTIAPLTDAYTVFGQAYVPPLVSWILGIIAVIVFIVMGIKSRATQKKYKFTVEPMKMLILKWVIAAAVILLLSYVMADYRGIPVPVIILIAIVLIFTFVASQTTFGRKLYAIGGNIEAVRYSGINIKKTLIAVFAVNGLIAAIGGLVLTSRQGAGIASNGDGMELDAIASAVIGGASMSGGVGKVYGAVIGALIMSTIDNGMTMLNIDTYWQYLVKGLILIAAVSFDIISKKTSK